MMRGTAVGATGDALGEFNEALSAGSVFEARDYSSIVRAFSPQNQSLIGRCRSAIARRAPHWGRGTNSIKRLGAPSVAAAVPPSARSGLIWATLWALKPRSVAPAPRFGPRTGYLHPAAAHYNARLLAKTLRAAPIV
jgi:hypothetical protein